MSKLCIKYKRVILVIGRKDICGVSLSLHIARNGSILQFFHNLLDCKRLCLSRPRPMLTQFNHIVSGLQMLLNHDPINVNCVSFVALHRNRRTVWAFWDQNLRAVHSFPFFAKADSHHHVCLAGQCNAGVAISTIVARRQNLNVIEVNLYQLYLDLKLSAIDPQSLGLKKKRSSIATGF